MSRFLFSICLLALIACPGRGWSREPKVGSQDENLTGPFVSLEGHISLFSDLIEWSLLSGSFGYGARAGYRFKKIGIFLHIEHNMWLAMEHHTEVVQGAVNLGLGGEIIYANGWVRTSLALGPSILAFDTVLDQAGETGIFLDARPVGLRFPVHDLLTIGLDPITFTVVAPVLGGIPLIYTQYRTVLYLECAF